MFRKFFLRLIEIVTAIFIAAYIAFVPTVVMSQGLPEGMIYFYAYGNASGEDACPKGGEALPGGNLIKVGKESADPVGTPLEDKTDPMHTHGKRVLVYPNLEPMSIYSSTCDKGGSEDKSGNCNFSGAAPGPFTGIGFVESASSGLSFFQITACKQTEKPASKSGLDVFPVGAVVFTTGVSLCSQIDHSWKSFNNAGNGLFIVTPMSGQSVGFSAVVGEKGDTNHVHVLKGEFATPTVYFAAVAGKEGEKGGRLAVSKTDYKYYNDTDAGPGLPYLQYPLCEKQESERRYRYNIPSGVVVFSNTACTDGWSEVRDKNGDRPDGRFIVTLLGGGANLTAFGAQPGIDNTTMVSHRHEGTALISPPAAGVTVRSTVAPVDPKNPGNYAGIFLHAPKDIETNESKVNAPYVRLRLCQKN